MEREKCLTPPLSIGYPDFLLKIKHLPKFENVLHTEVISSIKRITISISRTM